MSSCSSPEPMKLKTDQTSSDTEVQQQPASSPDAIQQLRESLRLEFEQESIDGGTPLCFQLPSGKQLTYNFDLSTSFTKMLYKYVFFAGLLNERFRIYSMPEKRPIPCNDNKICDICLSDITTFIVEYEEGDVILMLQTVELIEDGQCYIQVDIPGADGDVADTYVSGNKWYYREGSGGVFNVQTEGDQIQILYGDRYLTVKEEKNKKVHEPEFMEQKSSTNSVTYYQTFYSCGYQTAFTLSFETREHATYYFITPASRSGEITVCNSRGNDLAVFSQQMYPPPPQQ